MKKSILAAAPRDPEIVPENEVRMGKDEMNLVEHPFALLRYQSGAKDAAIFDCEWEHIHPRTGKTLKARWRVTGDPERGLPGPNEERLYIVLMELTREQNWPREVIFSRGQLLKLMGWSDRQESYRNLAESFAKLNSVAIEAQRSFWDARIKDYLPAIGFGLIDVYKIAEEPRGRKAQGQLPLSAFTWNEIVWNSFRAGHLRSLDTAFALSLSLPLSLRLFRYLDKHRYGKAGPRKGFEIELQKLCGVHLGMTASPYASKLKERLAGAHHELIERGFLASVIYRKMRSKDAEKVCYAFSPSLLMLPPESETLVKGPETAFSGLRAVGPAPSRAVDSKAVFSGFLLADEEIKAQACDAVFESLPETEQETIKSRVKTGLAPFLIENLNTPGARGAMARGIRKEIEVNHARELQKQVLELS